MNYNTYGMARRTGALKKLFVISYALNEFEG